MKARSKYYGSAPARCTDFIQRWARLPLLLAASTACLSFALAPAVAVTRLSDLGFGEVVMNETKAVAYSDASAASFRIDATGIVAQLGVGITFTLPTQLLDGGGTIGVAFSTTGAAWSYTNNVATATVFNPNAGTTAPKNGANFSVYVWVGAEVDASGAPTASQYSNNVTLNAEAF